jgi:hypothetical protein
MKALYSLLAVRPSVLMQGLGLEMCFRRHLDVRVIHSPTAFRRCSREMVMVVSPASVLKTWTALGSRSMEAMVADVRICFDTGRRLRPKSLHMFIKRISSMDTSQLIVCLAAR